MLRKALSRLVLALIVLTLAFAVPAVPVSASGTWYFQCNASDGYQPVSGVSFLITLADFPYYTLGSCTTGANGQCYVQYVGSDFETLFLRATRPGYAAQYIQGAFLYAGNHRPWAGWNEAEWGGTHFTLANYPIFPWVQVGKAANLSVVKCKVIQAGNYTVAVSPYNGGYYGGLGSLTFVLSSSLGTVSTFPQSGGYPLFFQYTQSQWLKAFQSNPIVLVYANGVLVDTAAFQ